MSQEELELHHSSKKGRLGWVGTIRFGCVIKTEGGRTDLTTRLQPRTYQVMGQEELQLKMLEFQKGRLGFSFNLSRGSIPPGGRTR